MIRIGIDINHVLRNFNLSYIRAYDNEFATNHYFKPKKLKKKMANLDVKHNKKLLPFDNKSKQRTFEEIDHAYEIYGTAIQQQKNIAGRFLEWKYNTVAETAPDEVEFIAISPDESEICAMSTLFFLAKGFRIGHVLIDTKQRIWDECDIIITANPKLIKARPIGKKVIKINRDFNQRAKADLSYDRLSILMNDRELFSKLYHKNEVDNVQ